MRGTNRPKKQEQQTKKTHEATRGGGKTIQKNNGTTQGRQKGRKH